jgi:hypothetical protein
MTVLCERIEFCNFGPLLVGGTPSSGMGGNKCIPVPAATIPDRLRLSRKLRGIFHIAPVVVDQQH